MTKLCSPNVSFIVLVIYYNGKNVSTMYTRHARQIIKIALLTCERTRNFYTNKLRLIDVDLKIRRKYKKPEKVTKYFSLVLYIPRDRYSSISAESSLPLPLFLFLYLLYSIRDDLNSWTNLISRHSRALRNYSLLR